MNSFIQWLADSPLNMFVWLVYLTRVVLIVLEAWLSELLVPSLPHQESAIARRTKKILRSIRA